MPNSPNKKLFGLLGFLIVPLIFILVFTYLNRKESPKTMGETTGRVLQAENPTFIPTFHSIGIYWSPSGGSVNNTGTVRYKKQGTSTWYQGLPLWYDSRTTNRSPEYRGSLVHLQPGTTYDIELKLASGTTALRQASTWSENFPIASTVFIPESSTNLTISESGNENGYILYTHQMNKPAILDNCQQECISIQSGVHHVIIRGLTLRDGRHGIRLNSGTHDIVIEDNDISNWGAGYNYDSAIYSNSSTVSKIIVQRNNIHTPNFGSNSWADGHPKGPQAVCFYDSAGNHVIRYNDIYSENGRYFNDALGAGENYSYQGFPNKDSDIYGNIITHYWDDAIESEGANENVRIWGNYLGLGFCKVATAATSVGPLYIWRNISGITKRSETEPGNGGFVKTSDNTAGGRIYIFHNTILQPSELGVNIGYGYGGAISNIYSRNNILEAYTAIHDRTNDPLSNYDYDLYRRGVPNNSEPNGIQGMATYASENIITNGKGDFSLSPDSLGYDSGQILYNFNDGFMGSKPDIGAHEAGTPPMEFGVDAYRTPQPSPTSGPSPTPTPFLSPTPTPTPGDYVIYEAEVASLTNAQAESEHLGYTGSGYVNFLSLSGARISWNNLSVSSGGYYNLTFRYALGAVDRAIEIRVNGNIVASSLNFPSTNTWTNWSTLNLVVPLNPSNNTLEAITIGADGPNLDHLKVPTSSSPIILLSQGWNEVVWPADSAGKGASDIPLECPMAVAKENLWFNPYVKNYGGINFGFENGKNYYLKCNQEVTWSL